MHCGDARQTVAGRIYKTRWPLKYSGAAAFRVLQLDYEYVPEQVPKNPRRRHGGLQVAMGPRAASLTHPRSLLRTICRLLRTLSRLRAPAAKLSATIIVGPAAWITKHTMASTSTVRLAHAHIPTPCEPSARSQCCIVGGTILSLGLGWDEAWRLIPFSFRTKGGSQTPGMASALI